MTERVPRESQIAQMHVEIPGLMDDVMNKGSVVKKSNLESKLPEIARRLLSSEGSSEKSPFEKIIDDVREGKKTAVWAIGGIGVLTLTVGIAYEFGVRHGKDIHGLYEKLIPHRPKVDSK